MKIKTWKAWHCRNQNPSNTFSIKLKWTPHPVRIVPEATWKRVMAVVNAAEDAAESVYMATEFFSAVSNLREHERKQK